MASNSDAMMSLQSTHDISEKENSFALAIAVMRDRLQRLNSDEKNDLYQLLPSLLGDDEEERSLTNSQGNFVARYCRRHRVMRLRIG